MIGHEALGESFADLAAYLEHGGDGRRHGRIAWHEARNVWAPTVGDGASVMSLTAGASSTTSPVYHLSVSFDLEDPVDRALMVRVADRLLADLRLAEHQAVIIAHRDRDHAHFHLLVNRVHPRTGRVWKVDFSHQAVERSLRLQERELGLRENPGHLFRLPGQARPERSRSLGAGVLRREQRTGAVPYVESARAELARDIADARSYADLDTRLAAKGHRIEERPRGLVVTNGQGYAALSSISPTASRPKLEKRFGESFASYVARRDGGPGPRLAGDAEAGGPDGCAKPGGESRGTRERGDEEPARDPVHAGPDAGRLAPTAAGPSRPSRSAASRELRPPAPGPTTGSLATPAPPPQPAVPVGSTDLSKLTNAAIREITDAAGEATRTTLARITSDLRGQGAGIEARLEEAQGQARTVVRMMEELLDSSVEVSEATARTYRDTQEGVIKTLEEVIQRAEKQLGALVSKAEEQHRRLDERTQALAAEAQRAGRRLGWRPWLMATTTAVAVLSLLTAVRPGWTMSAEQRRALRVGEAVIYTYSAAREPEKAEMRRVMRWRAPERPDSTEAPPVADLTR